VLQIIAERGSLTFFTLASGIALVIFPLALGGCAGMVASATAHLGESLSSALADQDDPQTVREGAPAYLLLADSLIRDDPDNIDLLLMGAKLYGTFSILFVEDIPRAQRLTNRAKEYAKRALCLQTPVICPVLAKPYANFVEQLPTTTPDDLSALYTWALSSAGWIQAHSDDWNAVAELPKVQAALQRVVELNDGFEKGAAHLYLGVLATLRPPALGGDPEKGKNHFERAIALSHGRNLMAKVLFAKHYARMVFDRKLHDQLLQDVLAANPKDPGRTLSNVLAQNEARQLLATSKDYF